MGTADNGGRLTGDRRTHGDTDLVGAHGDAIQRTVNSPSHPLMLMSRDKAMGNSTVARLARAEEHERTEVNAAAGSPERAWSPCTVVIVLDAGELARHDRRDLRPVGQFATVEKHDGPARRSVSGPGVREASKIRHS